MHGIQKIRPISTVIDLNAILYNRRSFARQGATDEHPAVRLCSNHGFPADTRISQMRPPLPRRLQNQELLLSRSIPSTTTLQHHLGHGGAKHSAWKRANPYCLRGNSYDAAHVRFIHSLARRFGSEEPKNFSHTSALAWPDWRRRLAKLSAPVSLFSVA